jgi:hypothetical protein
LEASLGQIVPETLSWKYQTQNRAGQVTHVVEHLPSKCEALESKLQYHQKRKKCKLRLNVVIFVFNSSTQEVETGGFQVQSQPVIHNKTQSLKNLNK